jgi:hypothetical protein
MKNVGRGGELGLALPPGRDTRSLAGGVKTGLCDTRYECKKK